MAAPTLSPLRRVTSYYVDSPYIPDDIESHYPHGPSSTHLSSYPSHSTFRNHPSFFSHPSLPSEDRTLADHSTHNHDPHDAEKPLPPEERLWKDDIVMFDSQDDPENPKNVSSCPSMGYMH